MTHKTMHKLDLGRKLMLAPGAVVLVVAVTVGVLTAPRLRAQAPAVQAAKAQPSRSAHPTNEGDLQAGKKPVDPFIGTWCSIVCADTSFNIVDSTDESDKMDDLINFVPMTNMARRTLEFTVKDNGFTCIMQTIRDEGSQYRPYERQVSATTEYTARFDGKDYPIQYQYPSPELSADSVSLKRIDANTIERTRKRNGEVFETTTMKISANGKALTVTTRGTMVGPHVVSYIGGLNHLPTEWIVGSIDGKDYYSTQVYNREP